MDRSRGFLEAHPVVWGQWYLSLELLHVLDLGLRPEHLARPFQKIRRVEKEDTSYLRMYALERRAGMGLKNDKVLIIEGTRCEKRVCPLQNLWEVSPSIG